MSNHLIPPALAGLADVRTYGRQERGPYAVRRPFLALVDYADGETRPAVLPGVRAAARLLVLPAIARRDLEPLAQDKALAVRPIGSHEAPRPLGDLEAAELLAELLEALQAVPVADLLADADAMASAYLIAGARLAQHDHDPACQELPEHHGREDVQAYLAEALAESWREAPRYARPRPSRVQDADAAPLSQAEHRARHRARRHAQEVEWAAWIVQELLGAGGRITAGTYAEAVTWTEEPLEVWTELREQHAASLVEWEAARDAYRLAKWKHRRRGWEDLAVEIPAHPGPRPARPDWAETAESFGWPLVQPRTPSPAAWAEAVQAVTGAPIPAPTVQDVLARWIAGLPEGRHALADVWQAWTVQVRNHPRATREVAALGRTKFYALLSELGSVYTGHARARFLVIPTPTTTTKEPEPMNAEQARDLAAAYSAAASAGRELLAVQDALAARARAWEEILAPAVEIPGSVSDVLAVFAQSDPAEELAAARR